MERLLKQIYGYETFKDGQREVIQEVVKGKDVLALFPTGYGKSLCYELPTYVHQQTTIIVSPLLALMEDQVMRMKMRGEKSVVALNSFLTYREKQQVLQRLSHYRFIFLAPEMLLREEVVQALQKVKVGLVAIDEAHCISEWGFDFRPEYLKLGEVVKKIGSPPIIALTATANERVVDDIRHYLQMEQPYIYRYSFDRPNIYYRIESYSTRVEKEERLIQLVLTTAAPGIVYMSSRQKTEEVAEQLQRLGIRAEAYHAGKSTLERMYIYEQYMRDDIEWVIATTAFGMGIDKPNIRHVIHEQLPLSIVSYVQEVGRAGRDGEQAIATLLFTPKDVERAQFLTTSHLPTKEDIRQYLQRERVVEQWPEEKKELLATYQSLYFGEEEAIVDAIERLNELKLTDLQQMYSFVYHTGCYREQLLSFFDEALSTRPTYCCKNCHEDFLLLRKKEQFHEHRIEEGWKKRLRTLLD